ncbi:MAG: hypothetical protein OXC17_03650 [Aestuariivita sp.]|nr:hypothetical protein [Aestuariivita sp.]
MEVRAKHDTAFSFLEFRHEWKGPHFKRLAKCDGLGEVRLGGRVAWRILGFRYKKDEIPLFVVVDIGHHKDKVYSPRGLLKRAKRMEEVKGDPEKAESCERPEGN